MITKYKLQNIWVEFRSDRLLIPHSEPVSSRLHDQNIDSYFVQSIDLIGLSIFNRLLIIDLLYRHMISYTKSVSLLVLVGI